MKEVWKDVKGYEGLYRVSNFGRIWSCRFGREISPAKSTDGYYQIRFYVNKSKKLFSVHRLVAMHFIPNPENKAQVNHKDGNVENNRVDNLEWATQSENLQHAALVLKRNFGNKPPKRIRCVETGEYFGSIGEAARKKKISKGHISKVLSHKDGRTQTGGYHWELV